MKKQLFSFCLHSGVAIALLTGCSKPVKTCTTYTEDNVLGGYNGSHSILSGAYSFDDSLTVTNPTSGDSKITIESEILGTTLTGTFDPNNCGRVILDSVIIPSRTIQTVTLNNIRAGGSGTFNGNKLNTVINIKSGTATAGSTNIPIGGQPLTGSFTKQ